jgi:hypothetical protein
MLTVSPMTHACGDVPVVGIANISKWLDIPVVDSVVLGRRLMESGQ